MNYPIVRTLVCLWAGSISLYSNAASVLPPILGWEAGDYVPGLYTDGETACRSALNNLGPGNEAYPPYSAGCLRTRYGSFPLPQPENVTYVPSPASYALSCQYTYANERTYTQEQTHYCPPALLEIFAAHRAFCPRGYQLTSTTGDSGIGHTSPGYFFNLPYTNVYSSDVGVVKAGQTLLCIADRARRRFESCPATPQPVLIESGNKQLGMVCTNGRKACWGRRYDQQSDSTDFGQAFWA